MPVYSNGVAVTAVYQGSSAISSLNNGTTPIPFNIGATDPNFADVELLLQDSFVDQSLAGQTVTAFNTQLNATTTKIGAYSLEFNGSNSYVSMPANTLAFGTGPFTVEFWMYWDGTVTGTPWIGVLGGHNSAVGSASTDRYGIFIQASTGYITHYIQTAFPSPVAFSANTWTHIASTRDASGVCRFFIDGILQTGMTATDTGNLTTTTGFFIGMDALPGRPRFSGFLDELRITVGTCRYTADFTPTTTAFPN